MHFHLDYFHFPIFRAIASRTLTTLHGRLDIPDLLPLYRCFNRMPVVSISDAQREPLAAVANFVATVHHGIPLNLHTACSEPGEKYLAFLGRISPEKGIDRAIAIARACGLRLKIAAKIDKADEDYFRTVVAPLLDGPGVEFVGEINEQTKTAFLGRASALLFPIDWPEPFGLVMIEAMACGTPVLAFARGSVPETIDEGVTGCIVGSLAEAIVRLPEVLQLDRRRVRERFEQRFSAARMAQRYVDIYEALVSNQERPRVLDRRLGAGLAAARTRKLASQPGRPAALPARSAGSAVEVIAAPSLALDDRP